MRAQMNLTCLIAGVSAAVAACADPPIPAVVGPEVAASVSEDESLALSWNTTRTVLSSLTYAGGKAVVTSTVDTPLSLALLDSKAVGDASAFRPYAPPKHTAKVTLNIELSAGGEWQPICPFQSANTTASGECPFTMGSTSAYAVSAATSHVLIPPQPSRVTSLAAASSAPSRSVASAAATGVGTQSGVESDAGTGATGPTMTSRPRSYDDCVDHYWYYPALNFFEYRFTTGDCPALNEMSRGPMAAVMPTEEASGMKHGAERPLPAGAVHPAVTVHLVRVTTLKGGMRAAVIRGLVDSSLVILVTPSTTDADLVAAWRAMDDLARQVDRTSVLLAVREGRGRPSRAEAMDVAVRARQLRGFLAKGSLRPVRNFGTGVGTTFLHLPGPR